MHQYAPIYTKSFVFSWKNIHRYTVPKAQTGWMIWWAKPSSTLPVRAVTIKNRKLQGLPSSSAWPVITVSLGTARLFPVFLTSVPLVPLPSIFLFIAAPYHINMPVFYHVRNHFQTRVRRSPVLPTVPTAHWSAHPSIFRKQSSRPSAWGYLSPC